MPPLGSSSLPEPQASDINSAGNKKGRTMNPLIHVRKATPVFFVALALACLALRQRAQATDWDGVLPGGSTADGVGVLADQTSGSGNSGFGYLALRFLTD